MSSSDKKKTKIIVIVSAIIAILAVLAVIVFFVPVSRNDCDSACEGDLYAACPDVCIKTEQTIWDIVTGQKRVIGY